MGTAPGASALFTDLYELRMAQAYLEEGLIGPAVFSLFVRRLPPSRNLLIACGLEDALTWLESVRFEEPELRWLGEHLSLSDDFLAWLEAFRFRGRVRAVPEGTPVFANEPLLEVEASLPEAQLLETFLLNQLHLQTMLASKAHRVVVAAGGRTVVDFGLRRIHGVDAGLKAARAFHVAGVHATSNVEAGFRYGLPLSGTMAHSYVQAHDDELDAFRAFAQVHRGTTLLVDTWDTRAGVDRVIALAREVGPAFDVAGIRLDSGDLDELARDARRRLDAAGLHGVRIFASGNLDEHAVAALVRAGAPIDAFGVGTAMGVSADAPSLDMVYKLVAYEGRGRMKASTHKATWPGPKQVWRVEEDDGRATHDVLAVLGEEVDDGRPLLVEVMVDGRRTEAGRRTLEEARLLREVELRRLPPTVTGLEPADPPWRVEISPGLERARREILSSLPRTEG